MRPIISVLSTVTLVAGAFLFACSSEVTEETAAGAGAIRGSGAPLKTLEIDKTTSFKATFKIKDSAETTTHELEVRDIDWTSSSAKWLDEDDAALPARINRLRCSGCFDIIVDTSADLTRVRYSNDGLAVTFRGSEAKSVTITEVKSESRKPLESEAGAPAPEVTGACTASCYGVATACVDYITKGDCKEESFITPAQCSRSFKFQADTDCAPGLDR